MAHSFHSALNAARFVSFGGCGTKGVAYLGCLKALQRHHSNHANWHRQLRGTCGSSSGCIAALAFLIDVDADRLIDAWKSLNIETVVPYVDLHAMFSRYGVDCGDEVKRIIRYLLETCGIAQNTTFEMLFRLTGRELRICVTNLNRLRVEIFSYTSTPGVKIADAMYWSMSIPFLFQPERYKGDLMIDGCALAFVPYDVYPLEDTMIFHAHGINTGADANERRDIDDLRAFATGILTCCARSALHAVHDISKKHPERFVKICTVSEDQDATVSLNPSTLESIVNTGFLTVLFRLFPDMPVSFECLVRLSIQLAARRQEEEENRVDIA